ncbi:MAG: pilus assembly protein PilM [Myxococcales bacterium]|nr:pilus assembly protein PilM [Myxococcales bacterium]
MSRTFAVDLGAWSVKVAIASAGFRHATVGEVIERVVPAGDEPYEQRAGRVLAGIIREHKLDHDTGYLAVGGAQVFVHVLEFGFKSLRRADLDKAVGAELEGVVPVDLEDLVYAFEPLAAVPAAPIDPGAPARGRVAAPTDGMRVLTYSMRQARAQELIGLTAAAGAEARGLVTVASLARLDRATDDVATAIVDVGHEHTHVVIARHGKAQWSRSITRGGRHVTDAVVKHWRLAFPEAEHAKHTDGFVASSGNPAPSEAWQRVHEVLVTELGPWVRELRQSLSAARAKTGLAVGRVILVGGGSRLRGLTGFVADELRLPVATISPTDAASFLTPRQAEAGAVDGGALAVATALDVAGGRASFDLRQGALAFKVDMTFIKTKLMQVGAAALVVLAFAGGSAYASMKTLRKAEKTLNQRIATESAEAFDGKPKKVKELLALSAVGGAAGESPMPKMSAYDLLLEINGKLPAREGITLNVSSIDIKENKVTIEGSAKTPEEVDALEAALKSVEGVVKGTPCVKEVSRGPSKSGKDGEKLFSFALRTECM